MTEYIYEPFAETVEYREVNETIIRGWIQTMMDAGTRQVDRLLDIATGVGTMVQLFLDNIPKDWTEPIVTCVDQSAEALEQTKHRLQGRVENLELVCSPVQSLEIADQTVDVAMWGNGIHYLDEQSQEEAMSSIRKTLNPNGWFFFNSAFFEESRPPESLGFYRSQIAIAVRKLRERGIRRDQSQPKPQSASYHPEAHYRALLERAGFAVFEIKKVAARLYQSAWEHISGFSQYAAGALHGYPEEEAAKALRAAVAPSIEKHGQRDELGQLYVPRHWFAAAARTAPDMP